MEYGNAGTVGKVALTGTKVGPQLKRSFPEVEAYARLMKYPRSLAYGVRSFDEKTSFMQMQIFSGFFFQVTERKSIYSPCGTKYDCSYFRNGKEIFLAMKTPWESHCASTEARMWK
jgi:hypothetical protein